MIDINKFGRLADEIIANATKNEMQDWFESYRANKVTFINFKSVKANFKMEFPSLKISDNGTETASTATRYSIAA
ncbi:MAG: hypothetical protein GDA42_05705 [Ekhidna sp.]|nr:hypothetical protein [Ekhidna sp.]MBC6409939.1 hypothetical protein [Ekhidna sp.]